MKERPIIMHGRSVRAIIAGRKTQTRRVVKYISALGDPEDWCPRIGGWASSRLAEKVGDYRRFCPHGRIGDRLWVRETWAVYGHQQDGPVYAYKATHDRVAPRWKSPMHMPRIAARLLLEITGVRVERLQAISRKDLIAEGIESSLRPIQPVAKCRDAMLVDFRGEWNKANAKRGYGWDANPWVWVIDFRVVEGGDA